jgi:hypothetical protein
MNGFDVTVIKPENPNVATEILLDLRLLDVLG